MYSKDDFKSIKNSLTAGLILGVLSLIGGAIYFKKILGYAINQFWLWFTVPVNIELYWLFIIFFTGLILPVSTRYIYRNYFKDELKSHKDYRTDNFFGIEWTWDYKGVSKDVYKPTIKPICPECKGKLDIFEDSDDNEVDFICDNSDCNFTGFLDFYTIEKSKARIYYLISKKVDRILRSKGLKL